MPSRNEFDRYYQKKASELAAKDEEKRQEILARQQKEQAERDKIEQLRTQREEEQKKEETDLRESWLQSEQFQKLEAIVSDPRIISAFYTLYSKFGRASSYGYIWFKMAGCLPIPYLDWGDKKWSFKKCFEKQNRVEFIEGGIYLELNVKFFINYEKGRNVDPDGHDRWFTNTEVLEFLFIYKKTNPDKEKDKKYSKSYSYVPEGYSIRWAYEFNNNDDEDDGPRYYDYYPGIYFLDVEDFLYSLAEFIYLKENNKLKKD